MTSYIEFKELSPNPKTSRWSVMSKDQDVSLGMIYWYGPWRKYAFAPNPKTVFEQVCLRQIADFCENETQKHMLKKHHQRLAEVGDGE